MENISKINFLPSYSYKIKKISFVALVFSTLVLIVFIFTKQDIEIISWLIALSLTTITFSKEKVYSSKDVLLKYYSLKLIFSFFIGFILAINLINYILDKNIQLNLIYLLILILTLYQISYNILKYQYKGKKIKIIEHGIVKTITQNFKLHFIIFMISIISLILLYIFA
jgi:hypothetical protein